MKPGRLLLVGAALLSPLGCGDQDLTLAQPLPEVGTDETPVPPEPAQPPPVGPVASSDAGAPEPDPLPPPRDAGPAEVAVETPNPVVPVVPPEPVPAAFDCSSIPAAPVEFEELSGFTSSEDFVFDEHGNYVGVDEDNNLVRISKAGERQLWAPAIGGTAGMAILPDGSMVYCDVTEGAIKRVYPNGSKEVVLGGLLYPNGLDVGPDGFIYVAENSAGRVRRINPDTGEFSIVANGLYGPNGVAFSDDPHVLYIGSFEGSGVYKIVLDDPEQAGTVNVFARPAGSTLREQELVCTGLEEGASCVTEYVPEGTCQVLANVVDCIPVDPCIHLEDGDGCYHPTLGICRDSRCEPVPPPCEGKNDGDACEDPFSGTGVCRDYGGLYCEAPNPCEGRANGDACEDPYFGAGECIAFEYEGENGLETEIYCNPPNPCSGLQRGDACEDPYFPLTGTSCQGPSDNLYCSPPNPCDGLSEGDACEDEYLGTGVCDDFDGFLYCTVPNPCEGQREGAACEDPFYGITNGRCGQQPVYEYPLFPGEPQVEVGTFDAGAPPVEAPPVEFPSEVDAGALPPLPLICLPPNDCLGQPDGTRCEDPYQGGRGTCQQEVCSVLAGAGGIDGMGVDTCGNVYASEYTNGRLWRISPAGEVELLATLPSAWIPNIKWGRGIGGFEKDVMYVADRDLGRLFGVQVKAPGAKEFFSTAP